MLEKIPDILLKKAEQLEMYYEQAYPPLAPLVKQCFLNTIETTVKRLEDGSYFVITGDIPAMWLRDCAAQIRPYIKYVKEDAYLDEIITKIIEKQFELVLKDPYANAFNESDNGKGHKDETKLHDGVWERKYEIDSLCAPLYLSYYYWKETRNEKVFSGKYVEAIKVILETFRVEQDHMKNSPYHFRRYDCVETDTLPNEGKGNPVVPCNMTWSGFRPSDDRCVYGYLVPSNMMAVKALEFAEIILAKVLKEEDLAKQCVDLAKEIRQGIEKTGVIEHSRYGKIYAYETDGNGNHIMMDDANSPSLLSIPYLEYAPKEDAMYLRTRAFVLSKDNPYYYSGVYAKGVGSPHTPEGNVWCIGITMQALTSSDEKEIRSCLEMLSMTHANTNYMHESFHPDRPGDYTRPWFAWANTLFAELMVKLMEERFFEK